MKNFIHVILTLFTILMLVGCEKQNSELNKKNKESNTDNTEQGPITLTYGYIDYQSLWDLDPDIQKQIISFNKSQQDYFIEVVKYGNDNYEDGLNALNAAISSGNAPDIIEISRETLLRQLGNKGVIENLYSYIDDGEWPQREDFVPNVLKHFEIDEKLYGLTPLFGISSLISNQNHISTDQITFDQFKVFCENNNDNNEITVCNNLSKNFLLSYFIIPSIENFVNMETFICDFSNPDFKNMLEFSKLFDDKSDPGITIVDEMIMLQEGNLIFYYNGLIKSFNKYNNYQELCGEKGILIGFPSLEGSNPYIESIGSFMCINSNSKYKKEAWKFISSFLELSVQTDIDNDILEKGFPITEKGFNGLAKKINDMNLNSFGEGSIGLENGKSVIYQNLPLTQEEVAYLKEIVSKPPPSSYDYSEIERIICEEIVSFWDGSKTVQEVIAIIQNRAQLYFDEK